MSENMKGAGGTSGGVGRFLIGLIMLVVGAYLFLSAIHVSNHFSLGRALFSVGGFHMTGGMVLVPFIFGIGMIFYDSKNYLGWGLSCSSLLALSFGVISSVGMRLRPMTAFDLLTILTLLVGGIGLFLSSLWDFSALDIDGPAEK